MLLLSCRYRQVAQTSGVRPHTTTTWPSRCHSSRRISQEPAETCSICYNTKPLHPIPFRYILIKFIQNVAINGVLYSLCQKYVLTLDKIDVFHNYEQSVVQNVLNMKNNGLLGLLKKYQMDFRPVTGGTIYCQILQVPYVLVLCTKYENNLEVFCNFCTNHVPNVWDLQGVIWGLTNTVCVLL